MMDAIMNLDTALLALEKVSCCGDDNQRYMIFARQEIRKAREQIKAERNEKKREEKANEDQA